MALHNVSTACLLTYRGKLLLIKENQSGEVNWDIPAGGLEQGETLMEGVRREIQEETGIITTLPRFRKVFQFVQGKTTSFNYLFHEEITTAQLHSLETTEVNILEAKLFSSVEIQELIDKKHVEHNLAQARLQEFIQASEGSYRLVYQQ